MQLLRRAEAPLDPGQRVFRRAAWPYILGFFLISAGTAAAIVAGFKSHWIFFGFALPLGFLVGLMKRIALAGLAKTNWLIRFDSRTLLLQFRSYLNRQFPDEHPSILRLGWEEVASLRKTTETLRVVDSEGSNAEKKMTYIDIRLKKADTAALRAALDFEQAYPGPWVHRTQTKFQDYPVLLPQPDVLRIVWNGATPGADSALKLLGESAPLEAASALPPAAGPEAQIMKLVELGEKMEAVKLIRKEQGLDLAKAMAHYDELAAKTRRGA